MFSFFWNICLTCSTSVVLKRLSISDTLMFLSGKWKLPIRRFSGSQYFQVLTNKKISAKIQPPKNLPKIKLKIENLQKKK